ncbi:metallophosphoesterase [Halomonas denitrificans]|nr:metallophosphoesterase [Halomonas denitrificans]
MKLLAVGDMHLGRVPASLPEALTGDARRLGPEIAWRRAVDAAIEHGVEAVLLAGDVVDRERDFFAGYDPLREGVERLLGTGIRVLAVAGNHDTHVLPRLADHVDGLELIGRGGRWESVALSAGSVIGWSFPSRRVTRSPLAEWTEADGARPRIGLLHCDRDQANSAHAPVTSRQLERAGLDAWLLGHIHKPDLGDDPDRPSGYLGSISALRATETGVRGPWLIDVEERQVSARQLALAPLAYEAQDIDVGALDHADALDALILAEGRRTVARRAERDALPDALGLRIRLVGEHAEASALTATVRALLDASPVFEERGCRVFIDRLDAAFAPPLDLDTLAQEASPAGLLARDLRLLAGPDCEDRRRLVADARTRMEAAGGISDLHAVAGPVGEADAIDALERAGRAALAALLEQRR